MPSVSATQGNILILGTSTPPAVLLLTWTLATPTMQARDPNRMPHIIRHNLRCYTTIVHGKKYTQSYDLAFRLCDARCRLELQLRARRRGFRSIALRREGLRDPLSTLEMTDFVRKEQVNMQLSQAAA